MSDAAEIARLRANQQVLEAALQQSYALLNRVAEDGRIVMPKDLLAEIRRTLPASFPASFSAPPR